MLHLAEISQAVAPGAHAVLLLDQAGWHVSRKLKVPSNITLLPLPAKAPELNTRLEIQFSLMNCQTFSTGFSSGAYAGNGTRVMLVGTFSLRETCQPAWSSSSTACAPGATACAISARCSVMASIVQRGSTSPTPLPCAGQMAPKM